MKKGNITGGLILILIGAWFLAVQFVPQLKIWGRDTWPLTIIGIGTIFLFVGIITNSPAFSIPAFIVGGMGGLLYYQNATDSWDSWAYAWTFIPGFVGLGLLFFSLQSRDKGARDAGFILLFISATLFFTFGSFLGAPSQLTQYWPLLLIIVGTWSVLRSLLGNKKEQIVDAMQPTENKEPITEDIAGEKYEN